jgi:2-C-methyl-D-erythritol 4-phosphate cytidylyltransferase/2-C-methyl-D-erythritol 2,4-cyclodiphosphate synthase
MTAEPKIAALIVAAGRGVRAGGGLPKQYRPLLGKPLLAHTLGVFRTHPRIGQILVVIHGDDRALYERAVAEAGDGPARLLPAALGGAQRQDSVRLGLEALAANPPDFVLIHDAARPFASAALIDRVIAALEKYDGAIPGLPLSDTIKRGSGALVHETVPREGLYRVQTPQGFRYGAIRLAHTESAGRALTDDAAVGEAAGLSVVLVAGEEENMKVTEPEDFVRAEKLYGAAPETAIGMGFDVHKFVAGDHVWLCGLRIPHDHGLEGHSDADVGLHAITDALLGAVGAGDIGVHFPPTDPQWKGAPSDRFLAHAGKLVTEAGGRIVNIDLTFICERPKIGPHRPAMVARVAQILGIDPARISIKATTTETLGFTGRREGLAAQAVASVALKHRG